MKRSFIIAVVLFVSACSTLPSVYVAPETLLNASSERVSFGLSDSASLQAISTWVEGDAPTRAELTCPVDGQLCSQARDLLNNYSVTSRVVENAGGDGSVVLLYDRIVARDCSSQQFGCSVSVNSLQMVADYRQYVHPNLSDPQDAQKAVESYNSYAE